LLKRDCLDVFASAIDPSYQLPQTNMQAKCSVFRPCIDLHDGQVKQIVGSTLSDATPENLKTNFVARLVTLLSTLVIDDNTVFQYSANHLLILLICTKKTGSWEDTLSSLVQGTIALLKKHCKHGQVWFAFGPGDSINIYLAQVVCR
jgi:hypothetical protein